MQYLAFITVSSVAFNYGIQYLFSPNAGTYCAFFSKVSYTCIPLSFLRTWIDPPYTHPIFWSWLTPHQPVFVFCINQHPRPRIVMFGLSYPPSPNIHSQDDVKPIKHTSHIPIYVRHLRENLQSVSTKWWTILKRNSARPVPVNGYVYIYLINVNLPSH